MNNKMLVVLDMTRGYLKEGAMAAPECARIVPEVAEMVDAALRNKHKVVYVRDWLSQKSERFLRQPKHCVADGKECLFVPELERHQFFVSVINKDTVNAFTADKFQGLFKKVVYDEIVVTGVFAELGVFQTCVSLMGFIKANGLKTKIVVPQNAADTFNKPGHAAALVNKSTFEMLNKMGIATPAEYRF
ncbi:MAG: cysteine hydrolase [Firmicutes bacterium]|nr:cysteine hydrolase [Bacillota bacterium]